MALFRFQSSLVKNNMFTRKISNHKNNIKFRLAILIIILFSSTTVWSEDGSIQSSSFLKFSTETLSRFMADKEDHGIVNGFSCTAMECKLGIYNPPKAFNQDDTSDAYQRQMTTLNNLDPILYALEYWLRGTPHQGMATNVVAASMAGIAVFQGHRFLKRQAWAPDWLKSNTVNINFAPISSEGFFIDLNLSF